MINHSFSKLVFNDIPVLRYVLNYSLNCFFCLSQTVLFCYAADSLVQYPYTFGIHLFLMCCCHQFHLTTHTPTTMTVSSSSYIQTYSRTLVWAVVAPISVSITVKFLTFLQRDCFFLNTNCLFYRLVIFYANFRWCEKR